MTNSSNMDEIKFTKMHGLGNDYIYIDCMDYVPEHLSSLSVEMSKRHTGIGSDGIILIMPSNVADFRMRIFNADGSEAKMCGNGSRCVGKYVYDHNLTDKTDITLETNSGVKHLRLHIDPITDKVDLVTVDMGKPQTNCKDIPVLFDGDEMIEQPVKTKYGTFNVTAISMGNPHGVIFLDNIDNLNIADIGQELEKHPMWPDRANIEFACVMTPQKIKMRVWERGSGETMACGTGACAVATAAFKTGRCVSDVTVSLKGGDLSISFDKRSGNVLMTGAAEEVFSGSYVRKPQITNSINK